jgi:LPXTG-motif cell wall-anchored protein
VKKVLAGLALGVGLVVGAPNMVGAYPVDDSEVIVSDTTVAPGATITVTFSGCLLGETVRFALAGVTVDVSCVAGGTGDAPAEGSATASLQAPTVPGTYTLTATGLTSGFTDSIVITVLGAGGGDDGTDGGGLPATGSDTDATLWIAGTALTAGLALTGVAWFRRRRPAATA